MVKCTLVYLQVLTITIVSLPFISIYVVPINFNFSLSYVFLFTIFVTLISKPAHTASNMMMSNMMAT